MLDVFTGANSLDLVHLGQEGRMPCWWQTTTCLDEMIFSPSAISFRQPCVGLTSRTRGKKAAMLLQTVRRTRVSKVPVGLEHVHGCIRAH